MSPPVMELGIAPGTHLDEEECLPFPIFIAELELLVRNNKRGKPDGVQLLELLQKLVATIPRTDKNILKQQQKQCEAMLYDVLSQGVGAAIRRLIYSCFALLYAHGDPVSIYTRINSLQEYLSSKEGMSRSTAEAIRVGLFDFLAHLYLQYGRMLAASAHESLGIASRTVSKSGNQAAVRQAALRLATAVVRGLNPADRSAAAVHSDAWALVHRHGKDRTCDGVRLGCLRLLGALCGAGAGPLWREGAHGAEEALRLCLGALEDPSQGVRDAAFQALGELAAASHGSVATAAAAQEKRPAKKASTERVVGGCVRACLVSPLLEAAVHGRREACLAISTTWMSYIASLPRHRPDADVTADLLEVAALLITAVNEAGKLAADVRATSGPDAVGELGTGLAGKELPPLQACALFVFRRGVMAPLPEAAQRKLLERLAASLDRRLSTPAVVVALEGLASLLEAVGEVTDDTAATLESLMLPYISSSSAAIRQQAAVALAALAAAHPAGAARMLSACLDNVASCAAQMGAPLSTAAAVSQAAPSTPTKRTAPPLADGTAPSPSHPTTPTANGVPAGSTATGGVGGGGGNAGAARNAAPAVPGQRALMDMCHGAALAACRVLLTAARALLGCPSQLQRRALVLAEDLVAGPGSELAGNRAICREVGFLMLGTLCALGVPQATRGPAEMAALWHGALGEAATKELDEKSLLRPGGELDLAVQLWWRAVALQALAAYVAAYHTSPPSTSPALHPSPTPQRPPGSASPSHLSAAATSFSSSFSAAAGTHFGPPTRSPSVSGVMTGGAANGAELVVHLAPLLQPLLELLDTQTCLMDPARAKGGPGGILAGAAATFTLCLLEVHLRAPGGRLATSSAHVALLAKACLRPFRHGLSSTTADTLTVSALRGLLSADDAPLGPWPPGGDPQEEALRAYTGSRGAPHLPPWLSAEDFSALITGGGAPVVLSSMLAPAAGASSAAGIMDADALGGDVSSSNSILGGLGLSSTSGMAVYGAGTAGGTLTGVTAVSALGGAGSGVGGAAAVGALAVQASYPQPLGLETALLTTKLVLLGRLLATSPVAQQLQLLEVILHAVQTAKSLARQSRDVAACRRLPLGVAAAVAALAAYGPAAAAARKSKAPLDPSDKVPEKLLHLAQALLPDEDAASPPASPLSRAAAEVFAASAAAGSDAWALRVVRALGSELAASAAEGRDSQPRAVLALSVGACHRARGGLAMQGAVQGSVEALVAAASRPGGAAAAAWALHGLWLVASSGGGAFVPRVRTALQLGQELLVSSFESAALRAACARLANASVAVLGPELRLGSTEYVRAKSLVIASGGGGGGGGSLQEDEEWAAIVGGRQPVAAAGAGGSAEGGGGDGVENGGGAGAGDGGLGMVLFVQQIILFAPHAVPPAKHVPLLLSHLLSRQRDLRSASALTLRHLAERSAEALRPADAAPLLFAALDAEQDASLAGQLRATLTTLLTASAPKSPSFWLATLSDVVFAASPPPAAAHSNGGAGEAAHGTRGGGPADDEDDGDKYDRDAATAPSAAAATAPSRAGGWGWGTAGKGDGGGTGRGNTKAPRSIREVLTAPHLRTRHFAADCLLRLVRVCVACDERHRDASSVELHLAAGGTSTRSSTAHRSGGGAGGEGGRQDLLIGRLEVLVDTGFKLATCPLESLRPHGVGLLTLLVQLFRDVPDPLMPGARLMEQYQAQVVSALRSSLGTRPTATTTTTALPAFANPSSPAPLTASLAVAALPGASPIRTATGMAISNVVHQDAVQHPLLQIAGGVLATCFLDSGLAAGDAVVMRRLMDLLSAPLAAWHTLRYGAFAEWVGARARVELLRAHAQCSGIAAAAAARGDTLSAGIVAKAHEPHATRLRALWALLLQDHAVLSSQPDAVLESYRSPLLEGSGDLGRVSEGAQQQGVKEEVVKREFLEIQEIQEGEIQEVANGNAMALANGRNDGAGVNGKGEDAADDSFRLTPALAAVLRPVYAAACPATLAALAGMMPLAAELASEVANVVQFRKLLELGLLLLNDAAAWLAHAVRYAVRSGAAGNGSLPSGGGAHPQDRYTATGTATATATINTHTPNGTASSRTHDRSGSPSLDATASSHIREAASRLAGVLRALQRLLTSAYLTTPVLVMPSPLPSPSPSPSPSSSQLPLSQPAPAPTEPLVPPTMLHDLLQCVGATAAHALLPLQQALLEGGVMEPKALGGLVTAVVQPCCAVLREVCMSAPELVLGPLGGGEGEGEGGGSGNATWPYGDDGCAADGDENVDVGVVGAVQNDRSTSSFCLGQGSSVTAAATETILLLASVCVPYSYGASCHTVASAEAAAGAAAVPLWLSPSVGDETEDNATHATAGASAAAGGAVDERRCRGGGGVAWSCEALLAVAEQAPALAQSAVVVLAAAQQLLRRAPWPTLEPLLGYLLTLPLRLILTAPPGTPVAAAASRYLETAVTAVLARGHTLRTTSTDDVDAVDVVHGDKADADVTIAAACTAAGVNGGVVDAVPESYAVAAVVALADVAARHVRALQSPPLYGTDDGGKLPAAMTDSGDVRSNSNPTPDNLLTRWVVLVPCLLGCGAALDAEVPAASVGHSGVSNGPSRGSGSASGVSYGRAAVSAGSGAASALQLPRTGPQRRVSTGSQPMTQPVASNINGSGSGAAGSSGSVSGSSSGGGDGGGSLHSHPPTPPQQTVTAAAVPLTAAASGCQGLTPMAARDSVLRVLTSALAAEAPAAAALGVLEGVRAAVQEAVVEEAGSVRGRWSRVLLGCVVPSAVERAGASLMGQTRLPLSASDQSLLAECLKLLVLAATLATPHGAAAQDGVMQVLVPLLLELAAPAAGPSAVTPPLRDMALKLITSLPAAAAGPSFKAHLAAQPTAAKLRLQGALREAAAAAAATVAAPSVGSGITFAGGGPWATRVGAGSTAAAATVPGGGVGVAAARRPAIQLKTTFALPLPTAK